MLAFISRVIAPESDFARLLNAYGWQAIGQSLVTIAPIDFPNPPQADWCFFSSKNAVSSWGARFQSHWPAYRYAAIGPGTAAALQVFDIQPEFAGTGDPDASARQFGAVAAGATVLFPGAAQSRQSIQHLLAESVSVINLAVYDNAPVKDSPDLRHVDALAFTSPLNAQAYFNHFAPQPNQIIAAIGAPTARALHQLGVAQVRVATEPSEQGLAWTILQQ